MRTRKSLEDGYKASGKWPTALSITVPLRVLRSKYSRDSFGAATALISSIGRRQRNLI